MPGMRGYHKTVWGVTMLRYVQRVSSVVILGKSIDPRERVSEVLLRKIADIFSKTLPSVHSFIYTTSMARAGTLIWKLLKAKIKADEKRNKISKPRLGWPLRK